MTKPKPICAERDVPDVGLIQFKHTFRADGSTHQRNYWLRPEGATRRHRLPSVTTILNEAWPASKELLEWMVRQGETGIRERDHAGEIGTDVHAFIEHYLTTGELRAFESYPPDRWGHLAGAAKFLFEVNVEMVASELLVCHPQMGYAGRFDLFARLDGELMLADFKNRKTAKAWPKDAAQMGGYLLAHVACGGEDVERVAVVAIGADSEYRTVTVDATLAKRAWFAALDLRRESMELAKVMEA